MAVPNRRQPGPEESQPQISSGDIPPRISYYNYGHQQYTPFIVDLLA